MRALYGPFLHGFKRYIRSEVWVSFALGPLGRYPYHHSHLISDLLQFSVQGMSCSSLSHISTFVSHLVSPFFSTSIQHFLYLFSFSSILIDRRVASRTTSLVHEEYTLYSFYPYVLLIFLVFLLYELVI